ncbi:SET domain-containing protein [Roseibium sp. SCP14]|uniref:SET domain-containing protein n=1 Tax=Roseibium sp. SCP14 TaxID=3141375 RepID=UPI003337A994
MVRSWFSDKVEKRLSDIEGKGLFALSDIANGELLVVKGGHLFDRSKRDQLSRTLGPSEIQIEDDLFIGPITAEEREGSMMYLNHSCEPNVGIKGQVCFHAMRDITKGEELTFDYATGDNDDWRMECACGSSRCRETVSGKDWQIADLQKRYDGWFSSYLQTKIDARMRIS